MKKKFVFTTDAKIYRRDNMDVLQIKLPKREYKQIEVQVSDILMNVLKYVGSNKTIKFKI